MSSDVIIFKDVYKTYNIQTGINKYISIVDRIKNRQFFKKLIKTEPFIALNGINFNVKKGEKIGVIGHNGAGKSTLLKLIGRVSYPNSGKIEVHGRTGGILELGAGFHPDLNARENIYMTAILYGYHKKDVDKYFDEIVSVSEIDKFIDVPLKKFSSGMKMKLAFALSMITTPDIVLLDEAFAVGDAKFKKKSTVMMTSFLEGKTLFLVSHSMDLIKSVCERVLVINKGNIVFDGPTTEACDFYNQLISKSESVTQKTIVQPNIKRGFAEESKVNINSVELSICDATRASFIVTGKVIDCEKSVRLSIILKKELMGQILDVIDKSEYVFDAENGELFNRHIRFDTSALYPGNFILEVEARSDKATKTTAIENFQLPFVIQSNEKTPSGVILRVNFEVS